MLTQPEIKDLLITNIREIQELSGRPVPPTFDEDFKPIGGCQGFDSINGVEVAVRLAPVLGCEIKCNPFADGNGALTLEAIAKRLYELQKDGANDGKR
jgi:hypothetical protein